MARLILCMEKRKYTRKEREAEGKATSSKSSKWREKKEMGRDGGVYRQRQSWSS